MEGCGVLHVQSCVLKSGIIVKSGRFMWIATKWGTVEDCQSVCGINSIVNYESVADGVCMKHCEVED